MECQCKQNAEQTELRRAEGCVEDGRVMEHEVCGRECMERLESGGKVQVVRELNLTRRQKRSDHPGAVHA